MAQPPKKSGGSGSGANRPSSGGSSGGQPQKKAGGSSSSGKASRPVSQTSGRPPVTRQPIPQRGRGTVPQKTGFMGNVDRVFPPFTAQRYVVIWLLGMIPLILIILLLTQPWNRSSPAVTATGTATTQAGSAASGGTTAAPQPNNNSATVSMPTAAAGGGAVQPATGPGKYMTIDTVKGKIVCKLYTDPSAGVSKTVANFATKAKAGYFNGLIFHRVEDWVIQGGDPAGTGAGGGTMPSEYNKITFAPGALGVARGQDPAINNDSQFFITKTDASFLDGQYTNWGQVVEGMDVVNKIAIGDKINSVTVEDRQQ